MVSSTKSSGSVDVTSLFVVRDVRREGEMEGLGVLVSSIFFDLEYSS